MNQTSSHILASFLLQMADNSLILGQRLSELCGHNATIELDLAISNTALDLLGESRMLYQYVAELNADPGVSEDTIAMLRHQHEYVNCLLVEQPNIDFSHVIVRQYIFDVFHGLLLDGLIENTNDAKLKAIAFKTAKENAYHQLFSKSWLVRLGDGTSESQTKTQVALDYLAPYISELITPSAIDSAAAKEGISIDLESIANQFERTLTRDFAEAQLAWQPNPDGIQGGKAGRHTEHMGYILAELQYMQRLHPNVQW
jgi:ring-1,2-phenylacetyl-CoA epoxidase subunit PaaC